MAVCGRYITSLIEKKALNFANGLYGLAPVEEKQLTELKVSIYNNMSVVHTKQNKNDKALADLKLVHTSTFSILF